LRIPWGLRGRGRVMTGEIGQFALILSFVLALVQAAAALAGAARRDPALMALGRAAALLLSFFVVVAFGSLAAAYLINDFSIALVARHSNTAQPAIYRFAATWGSHEGSMLLWVLILALYSGGIAVFGRTLRETLQARVLGVQGIVAAAFLGFSFFTSNPFLRLDPAPLEGAELNPLLQDPGLVVHPPLLYLGYVGLSVSYAFAVAALIEGRVDAGWARWVRPWVLAAWTCLTAGIAMGSIWAYYTLGWGGWWFWDPVENASLMPWLVATALLHSTLALERRGALVSWTILLAILAFSMSLIGTFLVRSGVLTSVHAFAVDPQRGIYILAIIGAAIGGALALFAWRAPSMRSGALFAPLSREGGITLNNLFLLAATATVFLGTFYPLFVDVLNGPMISVGPPYYGYTFVPIAAVLLLFVSFGPMLNWKSSRPEQLVQRLRGPLLVAGFALLAGVLLAGWRQVLAAFGIALGLFLIAGAFALLIRRWRLTEGSLANLGRLIRTTPLALFGLVLAHAGLGVTAVGVTGMSAWQSETVLMMRQGETTELSGHRITLEAVRLVSGPNFQAEQAQFSVISGRTFRMLVSDRRFFPASQTVVTVAGIGTGILGNVYISIGERDNAGGIVVRAWDHPLVNWIWAGAAMMVLGGAISLSDRRVRLGAAERTAARPTAIRPATV